MKHFIKGKKGSFHVIDTDKSLEIIEGAYNFIYDLTEKGGKILLVGTKLRSTHDQIKEQAKRGQFHFINQR
jgi:small subunit ribosomal protein S2